MDIENANIMQVNYAFNVRQKMQKTNNASDMHLVMDGENANMNKCKECALNVGHRKCQAQVLMQIIHTLVLDRKC